MSITVRFAQRDELDAINAVRRQVNDHHVSGRPDIFRSGFCDELEQHIFEFFDTQDHSVIAAFSEGRLCGFASVYTFVKPLSSYNLERRIYGVEEFGVLRDFRRMGVASAMIDFIKKDALAHGIDRIELDMWEFNEGAYKFYKSAGFVTIRRYMELNVKGFPTRENAERILEEAGKLNNGAWISHSRVAARCAEAIALKCGDLDSEKAYVLGLLHDIGRRFGVSHFRHVYDGYTYLTKLGYPAAAKICLTHSFPNRDIKDYIGNIDVSEEQYEYIKDMLSNVRYDDYDRLIQLCDAISMPFGAVSVEQRMNDVKGRYGAYPQNKWEKNISLKYYFSVKCGDDIEKLTSEVKGDI